MGIWRTAALVVLAGCAATALVLAGLSQASLSRPLTPLPAAQLAKCQASAQLRPACIRKVPRVTGRYRAYRARDGGPAPEFQVFDLEYFVPSRPPKGAHITVAAGAVSRLTPYTDPKAATNVVQLSDRVRRADRSKPVSFGSRRWNDLQGILYLAPPYLHGGQLGDHLVFQWTRSGQTYVVSLHAWAPLPETAATLRAMVATLS
jgi:hypothetical protein